METNALVRKEEQLDQLQLLIESKQLPSHIKTKETAFLIDRMGKELGFPTIQAMHYIIPIQGRLTLSAKAIGAVLRRNGVTMKTLEDCHYIYPNGDSKKTHSGDIQPVDRRTTILFKRNGEEEEVSFNWVDAKLAGLDNKDNWKRMPKEMMYARCLSKGANRIAQDLLLGMYSADEIFDTLSSTDGVRVERDEDGTIKQVIEETEYEAVQ